MIRTAVAVAAALLVCAGGALAEEVKGNLKAFDAEKNTITIVVDGKDKQFKVNDKTKVLRGAQETPNGLEMLAKIAERLKTANAAFPIKLDVDGETVKSVTLGGNPGLRQGGNGGNGANAPQIIKPIQVRPLPAPAPNAPAR
jgi:hypothetical protein